MNAKASRCLKKIRNANGDNSVNIDTFVYIDSGSQQITDKLFHNKLSTPPAKDNK